MHIGILSFFEIFHFLLLPNCRLEGFEICNFVDISGFQIFNARFVSVVVVALH